MKEGLQANVWMKPVSVRDCATVPGLIEGMRLEAAKVRPTFTTIKLQGLLAIDCITDFLKAETGL